MNQPKLPHIALSVRQPWAWLIVNGFKDIENRTRCIKDHLGPVLIHASATMTHADYKACHIFVSRISSTIADQIPHPAELHRGGIVGAAYVRGHGNFPMTSPWWVGPYSYSLEQQRTLPFVRCAGRLGFFTIPDAVWAQLANSAVPPGLVDSARFTAENSSVGFLDKCAEKVTADLTIPASVLRVP